MTCSTCKNWLIRDSKGRLTQLAKEKMAPCKNGPSWRFLPPHATCEAQKPVADDVAAKRIIWINKRG